MNKRIIDIEKINYEITENAAEVVARTEESFNKRIENACNLIEKHGGVALLAGPSSSGKTTTSLKMKAQLAKQGHTAHTIALDNFFVHRNELPYLENGEQDLESTATLNLALIEETLASLAAGKLTSMPVYDFRAGRRIDNSYQIQLKEGDVAIIEGLHALNPQITGHVTDNITKIYVDVGGNFYAGDCFALSWRDARFLRRMVRDAKFRGYPPIDTTNMWDGVIDAEEKYIIPFVDSADVIVDTSFEYELNHIKTFAMPLLKQIGDDPEYGIYARQIAGVLDGLAEFDGNLIPKDSLLREFTGGSLYADENGAV